MLQQKEMPCPSEERKLRNCSQLMHNICSSSARAELKERGLGCKGSKHRATLADKVSRGELRYGESATSWTQKVRQEKEQDTRKGRFCEKTQTRSQEMVDELVNVSREGENYDMQRTFWTCFGGKKKHLSTKNIHKSKPFIALQVWKETAAEYGFHINAARQKTGRQNKPQNSRMSNRSVPAPVSPHLCRDGPN